MTANYELENKLASLLGGELRDCDVYGKEWVFPDESLFGEEGIIYNMNWRPLTSWKLIGKLIEHYEISLDRYGNKETGYWNARIDSPFIIFEGQGKTPHEAVVKVVINYLENKGE